MPKDKDIKLLKSLGKKIKNKRIELKLSQGNIADLLDVSYTQIYHYETGRSEIPITNLLKLASFFNVDIYYFFDDIKREKQENNSIVNYPPNSELEKRIATLTKIYASNEQDLIAGVNYCIDTVGISLKKRKKQIRKIKTVRTPDSKDS